MTAARVVSAEQATASFLLNVTALNDQLYQAMVRHHPDAGHLKGDLLVRDLFNVLFKVEPEWAPDPPDPGDEPVFEALQRIYASGEFDRMRRNVPTVLDPLFSLMGAEGLAQVVRDAAAGIQNNRQRGIDIGGLPPGIQEQVQTLEDGLEDAQEFKEELGWGGCGAGVGEGGVPSPAQVQEGMALMQLMRTPQIKDTINLFGRLKVMARTRGKLRSDIQPAETTGITLGRDLGRLTPYGYMKLLSPALRPVGQRDYFRRTLPQYERQTRAKKEQGPILVLKDISGSMHGGRNNMANAVCMLMREQCQKQGRDCMVIPFNHRAFGLRAGEWTPIPAQGARPCHWPKGNPEPSQFLSLFAQGVSGGTSGWAAFQAAWWALDNFPMTVGEADILFVSDGEAGMASRALEIQEGNQRRKVDVYVLLVEYPNEHEARMITSADKIIRLDQMVDQGQQEKMVSRLIEIGGPSQT